MINYIVITVVHTTAVGTGTQSFHNGFIRRIGDSICRNTSEPSVVFVIVIQFDSVVETGISVRTSVCTAGRSVLGFVVMGEVGEGTKGLHLFATE